MKLSLSKCKKWLQYLLVALPFLFAGNAISQTLSHSWTFEDGSATDVVGGLTTTVVGSALTIEDGKATVSGASGPNDGYLALDASALALNTYSSGITLEAHIQTGESLNSSFTMLCYFGDSTAGTSTFWIQPARSGTETRTEINNGTSTVTASLADREIDDGFFHHVVATLDGSALKYYIDGELVSSVDTLANITTGDFISGIGTEIAHIFRGPEAWPDANYNASLEEFNIYSGVMDASTVAANALKFDQDGDLYADDMDNCPDVANPDQADYNDNGIGNACDTEQPAYLSGITVDPAEASLLPAFDKDVFDYAVFAPVGTTTVTLTATPEGSYTVTGDGAIDVTSGSGSATIEVSAEGFTTLTYNVAVSVLTDCYTPFYDESVAVNLVDDPQMEDLTNFGGWGTQGITTDPNNVYCGTSSGFAGDGNSGSLDVVLVDKIGIDTAYRVRAKVFATTGAYHIGVYNVAPSNFETPTTKVGEWQTIDFSFVATAINDAANHGVYFNTYGRGGTGGFIDNWEVYEIPETEAGLYYNSLSIGNLDSDFDTETMTYTATVPYGTQEVTPNVQAVDPGASVVGDTAVDMSSGTGVSTIVVTARDGSTTRTYTINYEWAAVAILSDLTVDNGYISPKFDPNDTSFTVYASLGATSVTFTATAADAAFNVAGDLTFDISDGMKDTAKFVVTGDGYGSSEYHVIIVPTTLKHAYTFEDGTFADGVINDQVGDLDGVLIGSAIRLDSGKLIVSGATSNTDGYVSFDAATLALPTFDAITLEFQVQSYDLANSSYTMLAYFGNNTGGSRCFWYQPTRNTTESRAEANTGGGSAVASLSGTEVDDGLFHHVVVVLTADSLTYYLDGVNVASSATTGNPIPDIDVEIAQLFKGPDGWGDPNYNGQLEEFNIFNGALDPMTIAERALTYDADGDLYADVFDNCPDNFNPNQADADGDGIGNLCDDDFGGLATLSELTPDSGKLLPDFEPETYNYKVYAAYGATSVTLTAVASDPAYTITGDLTVDISSGSGSTSLLVEGTASETSSTYTITVIGVAVKHSYTFDNDPVDGAVADEIGDLAGQIQGAGIVENGSFVSASATDGISFDGTLLDLASYDAITLETYVVSSDANTSWHMLNYFGGANGADNVTVQPAREDDVVRAEFVGAIIDADFEVVDNEYHQFVSTFSNEEVSLYIDGVLIGSAPAVGKIETINATNAYLCLSGWPDDAWQGRVLEFNIYNGIMDAATVASRANLFDNDGDGIVNDDDDDDDNDGQLDVQEIACGSDPLDAESMSVDENENNIPDCQEADDDSDTILNFEDNCPSDANTDQSDIDGDGIGDACDDDIDGDGVLNENDSCPTAFNIGDVDEDGIDEVCDELSATNRLTGQNDLAFGEIGIGTDATLSLTIVNLGNDALEITDIQTPEGFSVDKTTLTVATGLAIVKVTFAPTSPGEYTGDVSVVSNAGTSTIPVTGTASGVLSANPRDLKIVMGPNPVVDGQLNIDWSKSEFNNPTIKVLSIDGREISTQKFENVNYTTIDVSNVSKGLFLIQMVSEGKAYNFKMLKN